MMGIKEIRKFEFVCDSDVRCGMFKKKTRVVIKASKPLMPKGWKKEGDKIFCPFCTEGCDHDFNENSVLNTFAGPVYKYVCSKCEMTLYE